MKKKLKDIIQENKSDFETSGAPDFIWDNIEKELHPKKKRRGLWITFGSIGGAVAAAALLLLYILPNSKTKEGPGEREK